MKYLGAILFCFVICWGMPLILVGIGNGSLNRDYTSPGDMLPGLSVAEYLSIGIIGSIVCFPLMVYAINKSEKKRKEKEEREKLQAEVNRRLLEEIDRQRNMRN